MISLEVAQFLILQSLCMAIRLGVNEVKICVDAVVSNEVKHPIL